MAIDERFIKALHVETLRSRDLAAELRDRHAHELFQTSTIEALLEGAYDGDVSFAELAARGDFGLGTLDACDGEMIAVDGAFLRAAADGAVNAIAPAERTPFAVVTFFRPSVETTLDGPLDHDGLTAAIERHVRPELACHAVRIDGRFDYLRARSVPRQSKPYPPLLEVVKQQRVFELHDIEGTVVGFRFPDYASGLNVPGYHLHFVDSTRSRGGHVLECRTRRATLALDHTAELHVELPPGVRLGAPGPAGGPSAALRSVERSG